MPRREKSSVPVGQDEQTRGRPASSRPTQTLAITQEDTELENALVTAATPEEEPNRSLQSLLILTTSGRLNPSKLPNNEGILIYLA